MTPSPFASLAPNVGDAAPRFSLPAVLADGSEGEISLAWLIGTSRTGVIVFFYPEAMTPGCTAEACEFRDSLEGLTRAGYTLVGISPDPLGRLESFRHAESLTYALASDADNAVSSAYNAFGEHNVMGHLKTSVIRSTFVVGTDGHLTHAMRNVRAKGHVARLMNVLTL